MERFCDKPSDQKFRIDKGSKEGEITIGEQVVVINFRGKPNGLDDTVTEQTTALSPVTFS